MWISGSKIIEINSKIILLWSNFEEGWKNSQKYNKVYEPNSKDKTILLLIILLTYANVGATVNKTCIRSGNIQSFVL